jgi:hypothetical protein
MRRRIENAIGYGGVVVLIAALVSLIQSATPGMDMIRLGDALSRGTQSTEIPSTLSSGATRNEEAIKLLGEKENDKDAYPAPALELLELLAADGFHYAGATDSLSILQRDPNGADASTLKLTLRPTDTIVSISLVTGNRVAICYTSDTPDRKALTLENYSALLEDARAAYYSQAAITFSCTTGNKADLTKPN